MEDTPMETSVEAKPFKRLSKAIKPINYNIRLEPNLETFQCVGEETVDVEVSNE